MSATLFIGRSVQRTVDGSPFRESPYIRGYVFRSKRGDDRLRRPRFAIRAVTSEALEP
jgi:hypothetical protein